MANAPIQDDEPKHPAHRALLFVLAGQMVLGAALLTWVAMGRPLPGDAPAVGKDKPTLAPVATVDRFDGATFTA